MEDKKRINWFAILVGIGFAYIFAAIVAVLFSLLEKRMESSISSISSPEASVIIILAISIAFTCFINVVVGSTVAVTLSSTRRILVYTFISSYLATTIPIIFKIGIIISSIFSNGLIEQFQSPVLSTSLVTLLLYLLFTFIFCMIWSEILKRYPVIVQKTRGVLSRLKGEAL